MVQPGGQPHPSNTHAAAARRAVAALLDAKAAGDDAARNRHARRLQRELTLHLAEYRRRLA